MYKRCDGLIQTNGKRTLVVGTNVGTNVLYKNVTAARLDR